MAALAMLAGGFAGGVFLRSLYHLGLASTTFVILIATLLSVAGFFMPRRAYSLGALFFLLVACGMVRVSLTDTRAPDAFAASLKQRVSYDGVVVTDPDVRDASQRVEISVRKDGAQTALLAVAPRYPTLMVGDRVRVSGTLQTPQAFEDDNGRTFRYDTYLQARGVRFLLNFAYVSVERHAPWYSVSAALARVKHAFVRGLDSALTEPYASLAGGIVIGGKSGLGADLQNEFVKSGLVQVIVLSGYNVMVVAEWVMAALGYFTLSRRVSAAAGALAILLFVGIAGASATAVRAALMALIALYARATGRTYAANRALLLAVFLMLLWNPLYLVFDPGFALSVAATAGLIWLAPRIEPLLSFLKNAFWKNALATTLAAQIAVLPLLLYDTGNLSLVAIPANLFIMPVIPAAMAFSALAGLVGILCAQSAPFLAVIFAYPAYLLTGYLVAVARISASLPLSAFILPAFPFIYVLFAYALLAYAASSKRFSTTLQFRFSKKASM